jgi:hypothetical protein
VVGRSADKILTINFDILRYATQVLGFERIFQYDIDNEKLTPGFEIAV